MEGRLTPSHKPHNPYLTTMSISTLKNYLSNLSLADQDQLEAELAQYQAERVAERIEATKKSGEAASSLINKAVSKGQYISEVGTQIQKNINKAFTANQMLAQNIGPVAATFLKQALAYSNKEGQAYANLLAKITIEQCVNAAFSTRDLQLYEDYFIGFTAEQLKEKGIVKKANSFFASPDAALINVIDAIGQDIETSMKMQALSEFNKLEAFKVFNNTLKDPLFGADYAAKAAAEAIDSVDGFEWQALTRKQRVYLGEAMLSALVVDSIYGQTKKQALFTVLLVETLNDSKQVEKVNLLVPSEITEKKAEQLTAMAQQFAMLRLPMTVPPTAWSYETYGGYKANAVLQRDKLVRRRDSEVVTVPQAALNTLNKLQSVGYVVNDFILSNIDAIKAKMTETANGKDQPTIGKFVPALPGLKRYQSRKTVRTETVVACAEKFSGTVFYSPYSFDYRGRMYPLTSVLQPQGTDFEKALLKFADAKPLTTDGIEWLKIQLANCAGYDKKSYAERVQYVDDNIDLITAVATDPVGNIDMWQYASEPWQFLAACEEYYACCIANTRTESNLLVAIDATCSGIQILAGITKDANAAALVNVTPSDAPQDAYAAVAEAAKKLLKGQVPAKYIKLLNRKIAKKLVMTVPYNAQANTNYSQVSEALAEAAADAKKKGEAYPLPPKEVQKQLAAGLIEAMKVVMPGPVAFRNWLNKAAFSKAKTMNGECLNWLSPSGFEVKQNKNKLDTISIKPQFAEKRVEIKLAIGFTDEPNVSGHKSATMPNMIHSCDAAILHLAFASFTESLALIHDSAIGHANDINAIQRSLRNTYTTVFGGEAVGTMLAELKQFAAEPMPAVANTFDPAEVKQSLYFFC